MRLFVWWHLLVLASAIPHAHAQTAKTFALEGALSYGGARWQANIALQETTIAVGESVTLDSLFTLEVADPTLDYRLEACVWAVLAFRADGTQAYQDNNSHAARLENGLPVVGVAPMPRTARVCATPDTLIRGESSLTFDVGLRLPIASRSGWYVLAFDGTLRVGDSREVGWYNNHIFSTTGRDTGDAPISLAPLLVAVGDVASPRLDVRLFGTLFAEGSRFYAPSETALNALDAQLLPNRYPVALGLPALPVTWAGGQLRVQHTDKTLTSAIAPDGSTTLMLDLRAYDAHTLVLDGTITDTQGVLYRIDGTYRVTVGEPLELLPNAPTGGVLELDTPFTPALRAFPALDGEVTATFVFYTNDKDGALIGIPTSETSLTGVLRDGLWQADAPLNLAENGLLVASYTVQAQAGETLWRGTQREVYFVASGIEGFARGGGGVWGDNDNTRQVWFDTAVYPANVPLTQFDVVTPYYAGDVVYLPARVGFRLAHRYLLPEMLASTPLHSVSNAWGAWQATISHQIVLPMRPFAQAGDLWLWLGGTLQTIYQGDDIKLTVAPYFATVVTTNATSARVTPQGLEPLLTHLDQPIHVLYWLTGARIGQAFTQGDALHLDGYSVPLGSYRPVAIALTSPQGDSTQHHHNTNVVGFLSAPPHALDTVGVWRVSITTHTCEETLCTNSAGVRFPVQSGGVLGAETGFNLYVRSDDVPLGTAAVPIRALNRANNATMNIEAPREWTETSAFVTVSSPLLLLEERTLRISNRQASYTLNRGEWVRRVPALRDTPIFITFAITGKDASGQTVLRTRTFTWHNDRIVTTD